MANEEEAKQPQAKSKTRGIILAFVGLAFLLIGAAFVKTFLFPAREEPIPGAPSHATSSELGEVIEMGDFLTNLAKPNEQTYISVRVAVELEAKIGSKEANETKAEIEHRKIELKQVVEEVLRSRNREDLSTETGVEGMRQEILRKINAQLYKGRVKKVMVYNMLFS